MLHLGNCRETATHQYLSGGDRDFTNGLSAEGAQWSGEKAEWWSIEGGWFGSASRKAMCDVFQQQASTGGPAAQDLTGEVNLQSTWVGLCTATQ